ncbi:MAG: hypothetical protein ACR2HQ_07485 [Ilumatobacteraceae bacterium]
MLEETDDEYLASTLTSLADLYVELGRFDEAEDVIARTLAREVHWYQRVHVQLVQTWCALLRGRVDDATILAVATMDVAERSENPDLIAHAIEGAAFAAMARGELELASELFGRMEGLAREHDLVHLVDALSGLCVVAVLRGDHDAAARHRDQQRAHRDGHVTHMAGRRLASAAVDLATDEVERAEQVTAGVLVSTERIGQRHAHAQAMELAAAIRAGTDRQAAVRLLATADDERAAIGATPWPLDPYRELARRAINLE